MTEKKKSFHGYHFTGIWRKRLTMNPNQLYALVFSRPIGFNSIFNICALVTRWNDFSCFVNSPKCNDSLRLGIDNVRDVLTNNIE